MNGYMRKLREGASSAQFRDNGPEASANPFAKGEHWHHPNSIVLEVRPSSAWRRWGFTSCTHTGEPGQRKQETSLDKLLLTATKAGCGHFQCSFIHDGVAFGSIEWRASSEIRSMWARSFDMTKVTNNVELSSVKVERLFWV